MNINIDSGELFITYAAKMNIVARLIVGDATEAEDVVGDVFADVASGKIRLPDDNAEAMLMTCLRVITYYDERPSPNASSNSRDLTTPSTISLQKIPTTSWRRSPTSSALNSLHRPHG